MNSKKNRYIAPKADLTVFTPTENINVNDLESAEDIAALIEGDMNLDGSVTGGIEFEF